MKLPPHIVWLPNGYRNSSGKGCYFDMIANKSIYTDELESYIKQQKPMVYWYSLENWKKRKCKSS